MFFSLRDQDEIVRHIVKKRRKIIKGTPLKVNDKITIKRLLATPLGQE
jgi:hypothetical protein